MSWQKVGKKTVSHGGCSLQLGRLGGLKVKILSPSPLHWVDTGVIWGYKYTFLLTYFPWKINRYWCSRPVSSGSIKSIVYIVAMTDSVQQSLLLNGASPATTVMLVLLWTQSSGVKFRHCENILKITWLKLLCLVSKCVSKIRTAFRTSAKTAHGTILIIIPAK